MTYLYIFYFFLPFLFLFYTGIEVLHRDPRNKLHRVTMEFMLSCSLLYLGDFFGHMLPLEQSDFGLRLKLIGGFFTMSVGMYFFQILNKFSLRSVLFHVVALFPLVCIVPLILNMPAFRFEYLAGPYFRTEHYNEAYRWVIYSVAAIAMAGFVSQIVRAFNQYRTKEISVLERKRIRLILGGGLACVVWVVVSEAVFKPLLPDVPWVPYSALDSFAVLIFALFIRHAMVNYEFLSTADLRYKILFNLTSQGIFLLDDHGRLVEMNPAAVAMTGFSPNETCWKGMLLADVVTLEDTSQYELFSHAIRNRIPLHLVSRIRNRRGEAYVVESDMVHMEVEGRYWRYLTNTDITLQTENERKLRQLAYHDSLTGLLNRRSFMEILTDKIAEWPAQGQGFAVYLIDLDHFKWVNDTLGHAAGDELLQVLSQRLKEIAPGRSHAARMGGDEFVLLLEGAEGVRDVTDVADRLTSELNKPVRLSDQDYEMTASVGIRIVAGEENAELETILKDADRAMYEAKQAGRNRYRVFGTAMVES
ncbi:sensor domain-containing diguanylate cyclase [Cohnella candidum]|nr:sensor domain-containing diguanylate cyclase [Cohnella candidum]